MAACRPPGIISENGEPPAECHLEAHFTLAGVDPLDFPLVFPARQVAPPQLHGGADKRFPFSFQFWLEDVGVQRLRGEE
ncbi:hypothetical protein AK812_SmicGene11700 [Symbiodinium microadriaticum]|uniref:Uncharacterized protein n=1 Tax=Symbiodinium microadriaticum TaxID=2951 RepID=A0A1Q9ECJ2_SYMMI|nr:hypothetical protein AK812_SmicGene11700 [Symbiodinium microadriaticum]